MKAFATIDNGFRQKKTYVGYGKVIEPVYVQDGFYGYSVDGIQFDSLKEAKDYAKNNCDELAVEKSKAVNKNISCDEMQKIIDEMESIGYFGYEDDNTYEIQFARR